VGGVLIEETDIGDKGEVFVFENVGWVRNYNIN